MIDVDSLSVLPIQTAPPLLLVEMKSVLIPVIVLKTRIAHLEITGEYANAALILLVIRMELHVLPVRIFFVCFLDEIILLKIFFKPQVTRHISFTVPPPPEPECREDRDCASKEACIDNECKNPCLAFEPCARNARCEVHSSLPLRTMSCTCLPGFTGKGDVRCNKISKEILINDLKIHHFRAFS